jgi:hypothetical protein
VLRAELTRIASVPVDGDEHVIGSRNFLRRLDRVDEHQALVRLQGERADVFFPVVVPRCPTAQSGRDLNHHAIFPNKT